MAQIPKEELPDEKLIEEFARLNLPRPYRLVRVYCSYESMDEVAPADFQINIEFENLLDEFTINGVDALSAHQRWADPLVDKIRECWSPRSLRIGFKEMHKVPGEG